MARKDMIQDRIDQLVDGFGRYVREYDHQGPFTRDQLATHRETIALRRDAGSVRAAIDNEMFVSSLRRTLVAWGIGVRGSYLLPEGEFAHALQASAPRLREFELLRIDAFDLPHDIINQLWLVIDSLGIVHNKAKLVAGTKALHHLLPELIVPMDRAWTGRFFNLHPPEWQESSSQRRTFRRIYGHLMNIAQRANPQQYVSGEGWRTSVSKILDNALIGFCKLEIGESSPATSEASSEVSFAVQGYPPAKNEALSMLSAGHSHAPRVRLLLEAARRAREEQAFTPIEVGQIALDVVVRAPADQDPWDATNYLGGIGDVLEDKSRRGTLDHLGDLASIWLYRNDRQIKEITYRQVESSDAGYIVTLRALRR